MQLADLAFLACPVGMGAMMWFMMKGHKQPSTQDSSVQVDLERQEIARLRAEVDRLKSDTSEATGHPDSR